MLVNLTGETIGAVAIMALTVTFAMHVLPSPNQWFYRLLYLLVNIVVILITAFFETVNRFFFFRIVLRNEFSRFWPDQNDTRRRMKVFH